MLFLKLAKDSEHLLKDKGHILDPNESATRYGRLVKLAGISYRGRCVSRELSEAVLDATYSVDCRKMFRFPSPEKKTLSWTHRFTGNSYEYMPSVRLLAMYALGSELQKFILNRETSTGKNESTSLPIDNALKCTISTPLTVPEEMAPYIVPAWQLKEYLGIDHINHTEDIERHRDIEKSLLDTLSMIEEQLKSHNNKINIWLVADALGVPVIVLRKALNRDNPIQRKIEEMLESPLDYARRKVVEAVKQIVEDEMELTIDGVIKKSNIHIHYPKLKTFVRKTIEDAVRHSSSLIQ